MAEARRLYPQARIVPTPEDMFALAGDLDLVVNNINDPAFVYQNMSQEQAGNAWFQIKLKDKGGNINAVGAKVYVHSNGIQQYQEVNPNRGYLSCTPTRLHFGLEKATAIDSVKVIWPDGASEVLKNIIFGGVF